MSQEEGKIKCGMRKIEITQEAFESLGRLVAITNTDFSGKVNRSQVLSHVILHIEKGDFSVLRDELRSANFDRIAYLSSVVETLRASEREGTPQPDLESLLSRLLGKQ